MPMIFCGRTFDNFIFPGHRKLRSIDPSDKRTDTVKHTYKIRTNDDRHIVKDRQKSLHPHSSNLRSSSRISDNSKFSNVR
jgi:hypothetical protein